MTTTAWTSRTRRAVLALASFAVAAPALAQQPMPPERRTRPVTFEKNLGQTDPQVKYLARLGPMMAFITSNELVLKIVERPPLPRSGDPSSGPDPLARLERWRSEAQVSVLRMKLRGGAVEPQVVGLEPTGRKSHYVRKVGPDGTLKDVPHYQAVELKDVYPGVTMRLHGGSGRLEYDFALAPGIDPGVIDLEFDAPGEWSLEQTGDLSFETPQGRVLHRAPVAHQERLGRKQPVGVHFVQTGPRSVGFSAEGRDRGTAFVIDPVVVYEAPLAGSDDDGVVDVAVDAMGNAYAVGRTSSPDFPTTTGPPSAAPSAFVAKLDPAGQVLYSTLLPDAGYLVALAVGRDGAAYLAGSLWAPACAQLQASDGSTDDVGSVQPEPQDHATGTYDAFVAKLDASGTTLLSATCIGGGRDDYLEDIALDSSDNAWVVGTTETTEYCNCGSCQLQHCTDMFIAKLSSAGVPLGQRTIGGEYESDFGHGVAVDSTGSAYVVGHMPSEPEDYGLGNSLGTPPGGRGFLAKLAPGGEIVYATKLVGAGSAVAVDRTGRANVTGVTEDWLPLPPTPDAFQSSFAGLNGDAFFMRIDPTGTHVEYATYLGGPEVGDVETGTRCVITKPEGTYFDGWDEGYDIATDSEGNTFVVGTTQSPAFPVTSGGRGWNGGCWDGFLARFDSQGRLTFSTLIGGPVHDYTYGVAVDSQGNVYAGSMVDSVAGEGGQPSDGLVVKFDGQALDIPHECRDDCDVGEPVNLYTGNVWFDQTDAVVPGVLGLSFGRSYNSIGQRERLPSLFGPGWTHPYERALSIGPSGLRLRQGNGIPMHFSDPEADGTYTAVIPLTEKSWIVRTTAPSGLPEFTRHFRQGGAEVYDLAGRLARLRDPLGNETVLTWENAQLRFVQDPGGRALELKYDGTGLHVTELWLNAPSESRMLAAYAYYDTGLLKTVDYPDGSGYSFEYDERGQLLGVHDKEVLPGTPPEAEHPGRLIESHVYDGEKAITSEIGGGQEKLTLQYQDGRTVVRDANGVETVHEYAEIAGMKRLLRRTTGGAAWGGTETLREEWSYDPDGRVKTYEDGNGKLWRYTYNSQGDLETEVDPLGRTVRYDYTYAPSTGRVLTKTRTAPGEGTITWTYGLAGVERIEQEVVAGEPHRVTTFSYYPNGKLETVKDPIGQSTGKVTRHTYNATGDLETTTDPLGHLTRFEYHADGALRKAIDPLLHETGFTYDARGRLKRTSQADGTYSENTYDRGGLRTALRDPGGRTTQYVYDLQRRLRRVIDPTNGVTEYGYDAMSRLRSIKDARNQTTTFEHDKLGRVKTTRYPGGAVETFSYDGAGRLETHRDRNGVTRTLTYADDGALLRKDYSDGTPLVFYDYDPARRLSLADNGTDAVTRTYDLAGQLRTEASARNGSTVAYDYDLAGNRKELLLGGSTVVTYTYDDDLRLDAIVRGTSVFDFSYWNDHVRQSLVYPNGVTANSFHDVVHRLTTLDVGLGAVPIALSAYAYDAAGNRTSKTTHDFVETYTYDPLDRLTSASRGTSRLWVYGYDRVGNRTLEQVDQAVSTASYDARNRLATQQGGGTLRVRGTLDEPGTAQVNGAPARMLEGNVFEADLAVSPGTVSFTVEARDARDNPRTNTYRVTVPARDNSYTYDANGSLIRKTELGVVWTYGWNAENQLVRVCRDAEPCTDANALARFAYDALGRRVEKAAGGITTSFLYDGDDILRETRSDGTTYTYVHGPGIDEPLAREDQAGNRAYYHADGLGSIMKMTDSTGSVTLTRQYDAWGNLEQGGTTPGYAFTGREWDPEVGLYYYRARYYDPKAGRFISEDPRGFEDGPNLYNYVRANPPNFIDPEGTSIWTKGYRAARLIRNAAGLFIGARLGGSLTRAQAVARRSRGGDVCVVAQKRADAIGEGRRLEEAANADRGKQIFHDKDAHARRGNQPHWQTEDVRGHTFVKWLGGAVLTLLAENAVAASEAGKTDSSVTTTDVALAGAWDIATWIDPIFLTDLIEYVALDN